MRVEKLRELSCNGLLQSSRGVCEAGTMRDCLRRSWLGLTMGRAL